VSDPHPAQAAPGALRSPDAEPAWPASSDDWPGVLGDGVGDAPPLTGRAITLAVAMVATALLVAGASVIPVPYAITAPGPTLDTLGSHDGSPLISVAGAPTYPSTGELRLTTVSLGGGDRTPVSLAGLVRGWLDGTRTVLPVEAVIPQGQTGEEIDELNQAAMISSQEHATVAALEELGYTIPTTLTVSETVQGTGADGVVLAGDVLVALEGQRLTNFAGLSRQMDDVVPGTVVRVTVDRDGALVDLDVTTTDDGTGRAVLGVLVDPEFDMPVQVTIKIESIGGPSAGLMFSLGIIDKLTEADETGGERIAGTGTMDLTGAVGPIGGIGQKMVGARDDGAEWFLAPFDNCSEVTAVPDGLRVVAVGTLAEARAVVEAIGAGEVDGLPSCGP
jgi:PDZ domain-containing protein